MIAIALLVIVVEHTASPEINTGRHQTDRGLSHATDIDPTLIVTNREIEIGQTVGVDQVTETIVTIRTNVVTVVISVATVRTATIVIGVVVAENVTVDRMTGAGVGQLSVILGITRVIPSNMVTATDVIAQISSARRHVRIFMRVNSGSVPTAAPVARGQIHTVGSVVSDVVSGKSHSEGHRNFFF